MRIIMRCIAAPSVAILVFLMSVTVVSSQPLLNSRIDEESLQEQVGALSEQLSQSRAMIERLKVEISNYRECAARAEGSVQQFNTLFSEHARAEDRWRAISSTMVAVVSIFFAGGLAVYIRGAIQHQVEQRIGPALEKALETKAAAEVDRLAKDVARWMNSWDEQLASLYREARH